MKIAIILGTRPEIIKLSSIIKKMEEDKMNYFVIHTNQHFSENMDKIFFDELKLPIPKYNLNIHSCSHGEMVGRMLIDIEKILLDEKPDIVLVQGDTNSVLAGALTSSKLGIKIGHIEAGLRSFDKNMPEEINRIITDHISDYLFVPTENAKDNLLDEGINRQNIFIVGNTIVESISQNLNLARKKDTLKKLGLAKKGYALLTIHRPENTDNPKRLKSIFEGIKKILKVTKLKIIFPIHPRTKKVFEDSKLNNYLNLDNLLVTAPLGYLDFLNLEENAKVILTDSGGIQEEACIIHVPCITLRNNTERPETVNIKSNILVGTNIKQIVWAFKKMENKKNDWKQPFGKNNVSKKILDVII